MMLFERIALILGMASGIALIVFGTTYGMEGVPFVGGLFTGICLSLLLSTLD